jgi:hypothetical protein
MPALSEVTLKSARNGALRGGSPALHGSAIHGHRRFPAMSVAACSLRQRRAHSAAPRVDRTPFCLPPAGVGRRCQASAANTNIGECGSTGKEGLTPAAQKSISPSLFDDAIGMIVYLVFSPKLQYNRDSDRSH